MALNYEVKKKVFGFDQTKTEKYVAQLKTLGIIQFGDLCDEVTKIGMAPRGVVKMVLDGLIDTLNINIYHLQNPQEIIIFVSGTYSIVL